MATKIITKNGRKFRVPVPDIKPPTIKQQLTGAGPPTRASVLGGGDPTPSRRNVPSKKRIATSQANMVSDLKNQGLSAGQTGRVLEDEGFSGGEVDSLLTGAGATKQRKTPREIQNAFDSANAMGFFFQNTGAANTPETRAQFMQGYNAGITPDEQVRRYNLGKQQGAAGIPTQDGNLSDGEFGSSMGDFNQRTADEIARLEGAIPGRLRQLEDQFTTQKESLRLVAEQRARRAAEQAEVATNDLAKRFGFSGFGRSTIMQEEQAGLAQNAQDIQNQIQAELAAQIAMVDAEQRGASEDVLKSMNNQIRQLRSDTEQKQREFEVQKENLRLQALETGQAVSERERLLQEELAGREINPQMSQEAGYFVGSDGQPIYNKAGNVIAVPEGASAADLKFISGSKYQQSGYWDPVAKEFVPTGGGGRAGALGGGGGGGIDPQLGFDPNQEFVYKSILDRVNQGESIIDVATDLESKGEDARNLINEANNYMLFIAAQQAAIQEAPTPP